jgi:hypothetical protein
MAGVRVTTGRRSRQPGSQIGLQTNVFSLKRLVDAVSGDVLAALLVMALQPALEDAKAEWPVLTGASLDSMEIVTTEVGSTFARVALAVGGQKLISDSRNKSGRDYAPFIELNGSPTGRGKGAILHAVIGNDPYIRRTVHEAVSEIIRAA